MSKKRRKKSNGAALQAAIGLAFVAPAPAPAVAQPAPNASPQGGQVVAGGASITTNPTTTTITQSTARAAIDWRSFNVGRDQSVVFQQPGASSATLNRVTGPDPSAIAGRISANGQFVLTNPSGVTFYAGSQVNAQSVIVSAPGITNRNFMAGKMVFDQAPNPNARIDNAGTITVKEAGLAALVAPSVANSGTITARLGHVVLAGAAAHTLDMYGDGLVSIDITKQVTQAPVGPDGKAVAALVTNSGTIAADGGTIQLTAKAADGVVNTLVQAGGRIQANTAGGRAGQIEIAGTGGSVVIDGRVAADGLAPGTAGGSVVMAGSAATVVAPTARVTANGRAGGGTVAVGTTLARARGTGRAPAGTSARTVVAAGARISADATASGDGGRVTVLSTDSTTVAGAITAKGGPAAGNGGTVELSGETGFRLTGTADTSAPHGTLGTIVLDPRDLTITSTANGTTNPALANTDPTLPAASGGTTNDAYVTPAQIQALTGNLRLQTTRDLVVASSISYGGQGSIGGGGGNLTLEAGRNLTVNTGVTISVAGRQAQTGYVPGVLTLSAATSTIAGYDPAGTLTVQGTLRASSLALNAGTGGIALSGTLTSKYANDSSNVVDATAFSTTGPVIQTAGSLTTNSLSGTATSLSLTATANQIAIIGGTSPLTTTAGGATIVTNSALTVAAGTTTAGIVVPTGQTISLTTDDLTLTAGGTGVPVLSAPAGTVALQPYNNGRDIGLTSNTTKQAGALALTTTETGLINAATLQFSGATSDVTFGQVSETSPVDLVAHGNFNQLLLTTGGVVTQNTALVVNSLSNAGSTVPLSSVTLQNSGNSIPAIGGLTVSGVLALNTSGPLSVSGSVTANGTLTLGSAGNMAIVAGANVSGPNGLVLGADNAGAGSLTIAGTVTSNRATQLTAGTGGIVLSGSVVPGQTLQITSAGPLAEPGGTITGGTLYGTASSVSLSSRSNTVNLVSGFNVSSGDFLLVDNTALQVYAPNTSSTSIGISVPTGRTVSLVGDNVQLLRAGGSGSPSGGSSVTGGVAVSAPGGTLVLAPYTAGGGVLLTSGTAPASGLSITMVELSQVSAATLQLGGTPGDANAPVASTITIGQANDATIDLGTRGITRLNLEASGAVTQNAALGVTTLAGTASSVALANAGNFITELNGLTATAGDLSLHTSSGLSITNAVSASGNLTLSTGAAITNRTDNTALLLAANVSGATVRFDTTGASTAYGVLQTAGILTAGTLTGVASTMSLPQANQITNLGDFTATTGGLTVTNARPLLVTGAVSVAGGTGSVGGGALTLNAPGITQTAASSITTGELDGSASADTVLNSRLNAVRSLGTFTQSAGSFTLVTSSPELDFGGNTGLVTATTGSLTFVADAVGLVGQPAAGTSISALAGLITFSPYTAGLPIALIDTLTSTPANNALRLSTSFRSYLHSDTLGLGIAGYTGPISLGSANETIDLSAFRALQVQTTGAVTQGTGSRLIVSSLNGTAGSIVLANNNTIATLGQGVAGGLSGLAATSGQLTLATGVALTLNGPVSASTAVTLTTPAALSIVNSLTAPSVTLTAGGAISEASTTAQISANTLAIAAPSATLNGTANRIGTVSSSVSGGLSLTDAIPLTIAGGSTIGGTLNLAVSGSVTGGAFSAQALTGNATSVAFNTAGTQIASLGPFTTTNGFSLVDARPLTVADTVTDPARIGLNVTGDLTLSGSLTSPLGAVTLVSTGAITQPAGAISANTLAVTAPSATLNSAGNQIGTLSSSVSGGLSLTDAIALAIASGSSVGGTLTLAVTGGVTGGPLTAQTLTGTATSVALNANNQVAFLGPFATTAGFSLADGRSLTVNGTVSDPAAIGLNVTGDLVLSGSLTSPQGTVALTSSGAISQPGGAISAGTLAVTAASATLNSAGNQIGTLSSSVSGGLSLTDTTALAIAGGSSVGDTLTLAVTGAVTGGPLTAQTLTGTATSVGLNASNQVTFLGPFTTTAGFSLADGRSLTVNGTVSDPASIGLNVTGDLTLSGALTSPQGIVTLVSTGTITQPAGTQPAGAISAGTLAVTAASATLTGTGNQIGTLSSAVSGGLTVTDATALAIASGSSVGGTLTLAVSGAVTGGPLTAQTLTGTATSVALNASNQISALGPFTTTAGFSLADGRSLTVNGTVSDPASIGLNVTGDLVLSGSLSSPLGTVALRSTGSISQPGGTISANTLAVTGGSASLTSAGNQIGTLSSSVSGGLSLTDATALAIASGSAVGGTLNLAIARGVTGGPLTAQALTGTATSVVLTAPGNQIATLGPFATTGGFTLANGRSLTVTGAVSDPASIGLNVTGDLVLSNSLSSPQGTVALSSTGSITQLGGTIAALTLTSNAGGSVTLGQSGNQIRTLTGAVSGDLTITDAVALTIGNGSTIGGTLNVGIAGTLTGGPFTAQALTGTATSVALNGSNRIASLGPFTTTAGFSLANARSLTVNGTVFDPAAIGLNVTGDLTLSGALASPQGTVTLTSSGAITQPGGTIAASTLAVTSASGALIAAGNRIGTLTSAVAGDLVVADATALTIAGGSTIGGTLNLSVTGSVTGGPFTTQALTGTATSVSLNANNRIASLGPFTTTGGFSLTDAQSLTVNGTVSDPAAIRLSVTGDLALAGSLASPQGAVTLSASGAITEPGGAISANTLALTAASGALTGAGNRIGTVTSAVAGDLTVASATALTIAGGSTVGGTLNLDVAGAVTGGPFTAQALAGTAGSVALNDAGNRITSLGPFTSTVGFSLADARSLTVNGTVSDTTAIALTTAGDLTLAGLLASPQGSVALISSGSISQTGGAITAATLTGSATGSAIMGQAGNSVATLAGFLTGGDFTLVDGRSLVVSAPVDPNTVSMSVTGDLMLNSSVTGNTVVLNATGAIVEGPGGRVIADTLTGSSDSASLNGANQIATLGPFATTIGFALNNAGALTAAGPLSDGRSIALTAGPITLAGDVSAPAVSLTASGAINQASGTLTAGSSLAVAASGAFTQEGGTLSAGSLSGSADSIDLGRGGPAAIGQIADLAATGQSPGTISVVAMTPLRISGTVSGRYVSVTSTGSMVLADGTIIRTDGQPAFAQLGGTDASPGSNLLVRAGPGGTGTLTQEGTASVVPLTGSVATLRLDLPASGGTIALSNLQGLNTDLVLNLGNGSAIGSVAVRNLTVLGARGRAALSGTVGGRSGDAAAQNAALLPGFDLRYTLNGCIIAQVSCSGITSADSPSIFNPAAAIASVIRPDILALDVLDLSVTRDRDDPTLLLPNISDKDY